MRNEIEILFSLNETLEQAMGKLTHFKLPIIKEVEDIYYYDPLRPDLQIKDGHLLNSFRVRKTPQKNSVTYKVDHFDKGVWSHSDEYEVSVSDSELFKDIIGKLGLKELVVVNVTKYCYFNDQYEIVIEKVENLGNFIEIEVLNPTNNIQREKEQAREFLLSLGFLLGTEQNAGKPELLLRK